MQEVVKLNSGEEVEINVRNLNTRKAFQLIDGCVKVESMTMTTKETVDPNTGKTIKVDVPEFSLSPDSKIVMLIWEAFDKCVADFPQKEDVCPEDVQKIYQKYAEPIINKIQGSNVSPK